MQILAQSFEQDAAKYLQKKFPEYEKIELQLQKNNFSDVKIVVDHTREINLEHNTAFIPVVETKKGKESRSIVFVKVRLFKKVFVALKDFEKKEALAKNDFEEKLSDVTNLNGNPIKVDFDFINYRSKSFLKKGNILFEEKIEKVPVINIGDKVIAEVRNGNVILTTVAVARQCGSTGDRIELVSPKNKIITAKIVNAKKVIVE